MKQCEYPDCDANDEDDSIDMHTFGFTVDGMVESERDYCPQHAPSAEVIDP